MTIHSITASRRATPDGDSTMRYSDAIDTTAKQLEEIMQRFGCDLATAATINQTIAITDLADEVKELYTMMYVLKENEPQKRYPRAV
jgi:hypothetical protein